MGVAVEREITRRRPAQVLNALPRLTSEFADEKECVSEVHTDTSTYLDLEYRLYSNR